jgi:hypothetical protein
LNKAIIGRSSIITVGSKLLLHVVVTHTEDHCPGYNPKMIPHLIQSFGKMKALEKKYDTKAHFVVSGGPDHVFFFLLESDNIAMVEKFLWELITIPSSFRITPVQKIEDFVASLGPWQEQSKDDDMGVHSREYSVG